MNKNNFFVDSEFWIDKRVLVTGHTGFKGSWLTTWLIRMGANICGISLEPSNEKNLFSLLNIHNKIQHNIIDIRKFDLINRKINKFSPDIIFHLAAQPLVLESYKNPRYTWETNVMGTINILESLKYTQKKCIIICITTDKVYKNKEWIYGYRENDPLGGYDPYSSSKAAAEIAIDSWRSSFCGQAPDQNSYLHIASARSGNVIGGGDWSKNRIVSDAIRALEVDKPILLRNPLSTRPWQHVLDPLAGYLLLAQNLFEKQSDLASPFNFGPSCDSNRTVNELLEEILIYWPGNYTISNDNNLPHEAKLLNLAIDKAHHKLGWSSRWHFSKAVERTVLWYKNVYDGKYSAFEACLEDLSLYLRS